MFFRKKQPSERPGPDSGGELASLREAMVRTQIASRGVKDRRVLEAMREAPRHLFVPARQGDEAYEDHPLPIGEGQTISQPYIVALMTELAELTPFDRVLEIGTGCGYQTYILARLAAEVFTMEIHERLQEAARKRLEEWNIANVAFRVGNGFQGWPEAAPFDAIVVTAAPVSVPEKLKEQLADGGRLVVPVGPEFNQELIVVRKKGAAWTEKPIIPVRFVPMIEPFRGPEPA